MKWEMETETGNRNGTTTLAVVVLKRFTCCWLASTPGYDRLFCEPSLVYMALSPPIFLYWQILEVAMVGNEATVPGVCVK